MALDEHAGNLKRLDIVVFKFFNDGKPRVLFVLAFDLLFGERARAGNIAIEIVGMRRPVEGNAAPRLRPCRRKRRMRMRHTADVGERLIKFDVRGRIGRGTKIPLHDFTVEVNDHHVLSLHVVVFDARRFDDDESRRPVDLRDIAPCEKDKLILDKIEIGLQNLFLQCFQHIFIPPNTAF